MSYVSSKKYGACVQHYKKANGINENYCFAQRNSIVNKIRLGEDVPIKHKKSDNNLLIQNLKQFQLLYLLQII